MVRTARAGGHGVVHDDDGVVVQGAGRGGGGARTRACLGSSRRAAYVPANRVLRNGAVLTDANAVFTGTSAEALKHPAAPICVPGWNGPRVQRCVSALSV